MVRLLIPLIAAFFIWLLFFSSFTKRIRIAMSTVVLLLSALAFWLDMNSRAIRTGVVEIPQIVNCGVKGKFSYRSNFNLDVCLRNNAAEGTVKRLEVRFDALSCNQGNCIVIESRTETIHLEIAPQQQLVHTENLEFDLVASESSDVLWAAEVTKVWALK